ncbi:MULTISPECIES: hypothetical protein [Helcococcus]|uniref:Uncharacterized protein n=1 Tax=Helcococcus bovis TaxID=3153252 RepID=A0ABW9F693_9FIRM
MLVGASLRGLSIDSFSDMSPGQIVDFCVAYNNLLQGDLKDKEDRLATQEDFDKF